jgi:pyruvate formate lyase activating enzyme
MLGCDLHCSYCQNWVTSQALRDDQALGMPRFIEPERIVDLADEHGAPVMVSTYNEPLITADWAMQVFEVAREKGIVCGFVSNGNATPEVLEYIRPCVDLYKVDLMSFNDRDYRSLGGQLQNVLETIERLKAMGFWVEIVTLIVPGFNDGDDELRSMAEFLVGVSPEIPWHVTAFHPDYKMTEPGRTPAETLLRAYDLGKEAGLKFVYPGNLPGQVGTREHTFCPHCDTMLIERYGFYVRRNHMLGGHCPACDREVPGVWETRAPVHSDGDGVPMPVLC